ncbi:MAG: hypothetical protein AAGF50_00675 [Pseudomonadota bacterium]
MFKDAWDQRSKQAIEIAGGLKRELKKIENQIDNLLDRIVETENASVIAAYEKRIAALETSKLLTAEKLETAGKPVHPFEEMFEHALNFLSNPWNIWETGRTDLRRTVLRLIFAEKITYARNGGLRTPKTTLPFKALEDFCTQKFGVARLEGESLNSLFDELQEWEAHLAQHDLSDLRCDDEDLAP